MKDIKGYEGLYAVTEEGQVWSYRAHKFLKPWACYGNYLQVSLSKDKVVKKYKVHRLVAEAYIPNPENLTDVNHKDKNRQNNCLSNLEWLSHKDNINYKTEEEKANGQ